MHFSSILAPCDPFGNILGDTYGPKLKPNLHYLQHNGCQKLPRLCPFFDGAVHSRSSTLLVL